jgi:hypothetical protein
LKGNNGKEPIIRKEAFELILVEKPGSPTEVLKHFGTKGMRWGVRKEVGSSNSPKAPMSRKKKVAIGVGVATVAVGVAASAYILHKNGKLPLSTAAKSGGKVYKNLDAVPKIKVSEIAQAKRTADREHFIKLMMSSKKYAPTLEEATRIANETYSRL